tara:strand:- start:400 stop:672 length:273 start_codon:yes stop_codon:yes gene_type:complete
MSQCSTKKYFEELAHEIKMSPADRDTFIDMIVDLSASNPRFDEKPFRIASGQVQSPCGCWIFTHEEDEPHSWMTGGDCHFTDGHPEGDEQ